MIGNKNSFKTLILQENPSIVRIPCIKHKLDLAASSSCDKTISSYIDEFLQEIVHRMNSIKRSETFQEFTAFYQETTLQILPYSKARRLGRHTCIKRVRELYPSLSQYFLDLCFTESSNETFQNLKCKLEEPKTKAFLAFLEYILYEFDRINLFFQSDETMVHFLYSKNFEFLKLTGRHFLKPALLKTLIVDIIDLRNPELQKLIERID